MSRSSKYLIINADDYGYFSCVSRGILKGAESGAITATGIMANSPNFNESIKWLKQANELDQGVHLNISYGQPLTHQLQKRLEQWQGTFPDKSVVVKKIITRQIPVSDIENEWRAQIQRCIDSGIKIAFLNSHEHLHMLPPLYKLFTSLTKEYNLVYSRYSSPEWQLPMNISSTIRNLLLFSMHLLNLRYVNSKAPKLLGMNESGQLSLPYLKKIFSTLKTGEVYELMCHPGHFDSDEIQDPHLLNYHRWAEELELLTSNDFKKLCESEGIKLTSYRELAELACE